MSHRRNVLIVAGCAGLAALCGGCSLSFPIAPIVGSQDEVTGSIRPAVGRLADGEDDRRAKAALFTALDPQGAGTTVRWENPVTGNKGSFTPVGHAYPAGSRICRAFLETQVQEGGDRTVQGTACTVAAGEWAIIDLKPFRKG